MKRVQTTGICLLAAVASLACQDGTILESNQEQEAVSYVSSSGTRDVLRMAGQPSDPPSEFDTPPAIYATNLDAGFDPNAYAIASMSFFANHARIDVDLTALQGYQIVRQEYRTGEFDATFPWSHQIHAGAYILLNDDCGHQAEATAGYRVWHEWSGVRWGDRTDTRDRNEQQPSCNGGGSGGGGEPGGGGGSSGGGGYCTVNLLEPGCYDVYIDGEYAGQLCCT